MQERTEFDQFMIIFKDAFFAYLNATGETKIFVDFVFLNKALRKITQPFITHLKLKFFPTYFDDMLGFYSNIISISLPNAPTSDFVDLLNKTKISILTIEQLDNPNNLILPNNLTHLIIYKTDFNVVNHLGKLSTHLTKLEYLALEMNINNTKDLLTFSSLKELAALKTLLISSTKFIENITYVYSPSTLPNHLETFVIFGTFLALELFNNNLKQLEFYNCFFSQDLTQNLHQFTQLTTLTITNPYFLWFDKNLGESFFNCLTNLTHLTLRYMRFKDVSCLYNLEKLTYLDVSECVISNPPSLSNFKNLKTLKLSDIAYINDEEIFKSKSNLIINITNKFKQRFEDTDFKQHTKKIINEMINDEKRDDDRKKRNDEIEQFKMELKEQREKINDDRKKRNDDMEQFEIKLQEDLKQKDDNLKQLRKKNQEEREKIDERRKQREKKQNDEERQKQIEKEKKTIKPTHTITSKVREKIRKKNIKLFDELKTRPKPLSRNKIPLRRTASYTFFTQTNNPILLKNQPFTPFNRPREEKENSFSITNDDSIEKNPTPLMVFIISVIIGIIGGALTLILLPEIEILLSIYAFVLLTILSISIINSIKSCTSTSVIKDHLPISDQNPFLKSLNNEENIIFHDVQNSNHTDEKPILTRSLSTPNLILKNK
jgi:hypothetical protein